MPLGWDQAADVLPNIFAIETIFPDFNLKSRVGGLPSDRVVIVHGETHGGKTAGAIGFIISYLLGGHGVAYIDAEHSTPKEYMGQLVRQVTGMGLHQFPNFVAKRPKNYEDTITDVDRYLAFMTAQRKTNPELRGLIVVDSLNELTPKRELEQMLAGINKLVPEGEEAPKKGKYEKDKGGDAIDKGWGRVRAQLNAAWLSHLIPRLADAGCTLLAIVQEKEGDSSTKKPWEQELMEEFQILGGKKAKYAASLLLRFEKLKQVKEGEGKDAPTLAWEHQIRIWKSKVGAMEGRWTLCKFFMRMDGGFDLARNLIFVGKKLGVIQGTGWLSFSGIRVNGEKAMVAWLDKDPALMAKLTDAVSKAIRAKVETTKDTPDAPNEDDVLAEPAAEGS